MKTFLKILAGLLIFIIVVIIGLNIYFTDERLKETVMPYVNDAVGREVQVGSMSLTFFSTFPQPGLSIQDLNIPGDSESDTLLALDEFIVGVRLFPLLNNEISISEIKINNPKFTYRIYRDSTTNIDFLMQEEVVQEEESEGYTLHVPYFTITGGQFGYEDQTSNTRITMEDFNANISLGYADLINSIIEIDLGGLTAVVDSTRYINRLPLSLSETSTIDLENETINLESGTFSIRGLAMDLTGSVKNWGAEAPSIDLKFNSSSDNFGELLRLAPAGYEDYLAGLETRGALSISGSVSGAVGGEELPSFSADISVKDGYLKNPDLPQAIQNIQIAARASNDIVTIETFEATAGSNFVRASGKLEQPMEDDGAFSLDLQGNIDLSTVENFYSLEEFNIEQLAGKLNVNATASGSRGQPEEATFEGDFELADGLLKYVDVPRSVENININARANQDLVTINSLSLNAAQNRFSLNGNINNPMDEENRTVDLTTDLSFDLATIKDFYPIDEDTLKLSGMLTAQATLRGKADQIEKAVQSGSVTLENGSIDYIRFGKPIESLTLRSTMKGNRLSIATASLQSGKNDLHITGTITDYLSENPVLDLNMKGNAQFAEIQNYYDLEPAISRLTGSGNLDLAVKGPVRDPARLEFNGTLSVKNLNMDGDSLAQPVRGLNGELKLTPSSANLTGLNFELGSSDINLSGDLKNYMEYLKAKEERSTTPSLTGKFASTHFNMDELIDWEDTTTTDEPILIELPDLNSSVTASIDTLIVTGVTMRNLQAEAGTTPNQIKLNKATIDMFEGSAAGAFTWTVPQPDRTNLSFSGELRDLNTASFFREYQVLGPKSKFHEHVTGTFSANVDYYSQIDQFLDPVIPTTRMKGVFNMTKSRVAGHPLQERIASLLKADELRRITIDESETRFSVENSIMTIENLGLTSDDIGAEMSGTQHLINEKIDYKLRVYLPGRYRDRIASVISSQAVDALTQKNGTILVPLRVTGTQNNPNVKPDQEVIQPILRDVLKNKAGDALKKLFGGDG